MDIWWFPKTKVSPKSSNILVIINGKTNGVRDPYVSRTPPYVGFFGDAKAEDRKSVFVYHPMKGSMYMFHQFCCENQHPKLKNMTSVVKTMP